jgi:G3E family GTPase
VGELAFADTVLLSEPDIVPPDPPGRERGLHLIRELAPHAEVAGEAAAVRAGQHRYAEAVARTAPGMAHAPATSSPASPFATVFHRVERPLHPGRFRQVLATLAEGCCVLRGQLWVASAPACRIAIQGIGPRVWLENLGAWPEDVPVRQERHPGHHSAPAATVIAATGEDLDAAEFRRLLVSCQLTDEELAAGTEGLHDPFGLGTAAA